MRVANCSPVLDKNLAPMGPVLLSGSGVGVWRKAPGALPDSRSVLDEFQPASVAEGALQPFLLTFMCGIVRASSEIPL